MLPLLQRIAALFYPPRCLFCRKLLRSEERFICVACQKDGRVKAGVYGAKAEFIRFGVAPFLYQDAAADAVRDLKFDNQRWIVRPAAVFMRDALAAKEAEFDLVTWVPLYKGDKRRRGYDQSELLAGHLARLMGLPIVRTLEKAHKTAKQSTLAEEQRRANVIGVYRACRPEDFRGKRILLVDDVITTGSTVSEAARVLLTAGAEEVSAVSLAAARKEG